MNKPLENNNWNNYLETPFTAEGTVSIDRILQKRMKAFIKARKQAAKKTSK